MATLAIRISERAKEQFEQEAQEAGVSLSDWIRHKLGLTTRKEPPPQHDPLVGLTATTDDLERRLARIEEMAGL